MPGERRERTTTRDVAERLRQLRIALEGDKQGSQARMSKRIGIEPNAWSNYEKAIRRISVDQAVKVVNTCGVTLDWIYRGDLFGVRGDTLDKLQALSTSPGGTRRRA